MKDNTIKFDRERICTYLDDRLQNFDFPKKRIKRNVQGGDSFIDYEYASEGSPPWNDVHLWIDMSRRADEPQQLRIRAIYFGVELQRKGYGGRVCGFLEELAQDYQLPQMVAWRVQSKAAVEFFKAHGFQDASQGKWLGINMYKNLT